MKTLNDYSKLRTKYSNGDNIIYCVYNTIRDDNKEHCDLCEIDNVISVSYKELKDFIKKAEFGIIENINSNGDPCDNWVPLQISSFGVEEYILTNKKYDPYYYAIFEICYRQNIIIVDESDIL